MGEVIWVGFLLYVLITGMEVVMVFVMAKMVFRDRCSWCDFGECDKKHEKNKPWWWLPSGVVVVAAIWIAVLLLMFKFIELLGILYGG